MKLKNALLVNDDFVKALKEFSMYRIPIGIALQILKVYKIIETERDIIIEARNDLIKKFGSDDGRGSVRIPSSDAQATSNFLSQYNELLAMEFELPVSQKIPVPVVFDDNKGAPVLINIKSLAVLSEIIEFVE